jgi:hypothetical protein
MRHANQRAAMATQCLDAVALSRDLYRLHAAPDRELVTAAANARKGPGIGNRWRRPSGATRFGA